MDIWKWLSKPGSFTAYCAQEGLKRSVAGSLTYCLLRKGLSLSSSLPLLFFSLGSTIKNMRM